MITLRKAENRGHADHGWLNTYHTFSFASYYDTEHMGFRALRVINEDRVQHGRGFGTHGHRDMEIISYVIEGSLEHRDSMGNGSVIKPGDVQYMSAGTGVTHSEFNSSQSEGLHFYQIWILPDRAGYPPQYGQRNFKSEFRLGTLTLVATGEQPGSKGAPSAGSDNAPAPIAIRQNVKLYIGLTDAAHPISYALNPTRAGWVQVVRGEIKLNGHTLQTSDGARIENESQLEISSAQPAEFLLFDLN